jgi:predicted MFS family arabinose efflux permease
LSQALGPPGLAPFRVRAFRLQWPADLLTACAFEMETLILGWYVLVETRSVLLLTVFGSLQYVGTLIAPLLGVAGDRIGHRNLLCMMRLVYAALAATLTVCAFAGVVGPVLVLVIAGLIGLVRPSDLGIRLALVADNVSADQLVAAMGISRTTSDCARVAGALAGAGMFAAFGMGSAYIVVSGFYALGLLLTSAIGSAPKEVPTPGPGQPGYLRPSAWRDLRDGVAYTWSTAQLQAAMLLAFLVNLTAYPLSNGLLPYVAKEIYLIDQTGLGYLLASFSFGALLGSVAVSARRGMEPGRIMIFSAAAWYVMLILFAQMPRPYGGAAMLMLAGFAQSVCMVALAVLLLRGTSEKLRGRVMGVRMLAIYSLPLGLLASGALINRIGFGATATLYPVIGLFFTFVIALRWRADIWRTGALANAAGSTRAP